jgi:hypothetical protein
VIHGATIDIGLRGDPGVEWQQYEPRTPLALQFSPIAPQTSVLLSDSELSDRFNDSCFRWYYALNGTSFDIEDDEVEAAEATHARNLLADPDLRADDVRFYLLTAFSTGGWQWRVAEERATPATPDEQTLSWLDRYRSNPNVSRSELIGQVAAAIADDAALERHSPGGDRDEQLGLAFLTGGWLLAAHIVEMQPQYGQIHSEDLLQSSFRFGVALRDAQVAVDSIKA